MGNKKKVMFVSVVILILMLLSALIIKVPLPEITMIPEVVFKVGGLPITNSFIAVLIGDIFIFLLVWLGTKKMELVPRGAQNFVEMIVAGAYDFAEDVAGKENARKYFPLVMSIFLFVLVSNWIELLPGVDTIGVIRKISEGHGYAVSSFLGLQNLVAASGHYQLAAFARTPSTDLNLTVGLALISVIYTQVAGIQTMGIGYFKRFIDLSSPLNFFVGLLEIVSETAKIISFSFRLFGNLFAGTVLLFVMTFLVPLFLVLPFYGLEVFVGFIQAFVFAILTLIFLVLAVSHHGDESGESNESVPGELANS